MKFDNKSSLTGANAVSSVLSLVSVLAVCGTAQAQATPPAKTPAPATPATKAAPAAAQPPKSGTPSVPNAPTKATPGTAPPATPTKATPGTTPPATPGTPGAPPTPTVPPVPTGPVIDHTLASVSSLAYSPDGKRVALGTYGQVVIYDTTTWQPVAVATAVEDSVRSVAFSPDNQTLALGCGLPAQDGLPMTWDMNPANKPVAYPKQRDTIESIAFRADGKGLLCGANDNKVRYFAALPAVTGSILDEHNGRVQAVAFSPKADYIFISGGADRIVKVWDMKTMHTVVNFDQSEAPVTGLAFINESQFVGSSMDGKLYWWGVGYDAKRNQYGGYMFRTVGAHDGGVYALSPAAGGKRFITCGADMGVTVWNTDGGRVRDFKTIKQLMFAVALSPDGKTAIAGGHDGLLYVWDVDGNKLVNTIVPPALPKPLLPKPVLPKSAPIKSATPATRSAAQTHLKANS